MLWAGGVGECYFNDKVFREIVSLLSMSWPRDNFLTASYTGLLLEVQTLGRKQTLARLFLKAACSQLITSRFAFCLSFIIFLNS